jgi:UDPglucose 6-dehydrogenase
LKDADAVVLTTDWPEYLAMDWTKIARKMKGNLVFDARNALSRDRVRAAGLKYFSYGRL